MTTAPEKHWDAVTERIRIAANLTAIENVYERLHDELEHHASDPEIPGGMAMVMLASGADVEAWSYREMSAALGRAYAEPSMPGEVEPPLSFLAGWADIVRAERGQEPSAKRAVIADEVAFLRSALDWMLATDDDGAPWWIQVESFAMDLSNVRGALERVLGLHPQVDTEGACLSCDGFVALVKVWGGTVEEDRLKCPRCGRWYEGESVRLALQEAAMRHAIWLPAEDASRRCRVSAHSIRSWASGDEPRIAKRKDANTGRMTYLVADIEDYRDREFADV